MLFLDKPHPAASAAVAAATSSPPKWCQPGHSAFPSCLVGVHTVQLIGGEDQTRLSLGVVSHAGSNANAGDGGVGAGAGATDFQALLLHQTPDVRV